MANTTRLRAVEKSMIEVFSKNHGIELLSFSRLQLRNVFDGTEPDIVGYDAPGRMLYLGEITTSGYLGQHGRKRHVGAEKKVFEAFGKFYLLLDGRERLISKMHEHIPELKVESIKCYFIVPKGSKFIRAIGHRERLFRKGVMSLEEVEISEESRRVMEEVLVDSINEQKG